jgi:hypothetical protein
MGGFGSGRSGGRPTVESALTLDINQLLRSGLIEPMTSRWNATLIWRTVATGEETSRIGYAAHLEEQSGHMRLNYIVTRGWTGEKIPVEYVVQLWTTPGRFGGRRWWFECPLTGRRVTKLYLPNGATQFASRQAYRLPYASQREIPRDRALSRAFKARQRLGSRDGIHDYIRKPKWMRRPTFERLMAKVDAAEEIVDHHTALLAEAVFRKTGERLPW